MKFTTHTILFLVAIFSGLCCRKQDGNPVKELPPVTQEGKNTFGFMLGDEIWVPYGSCAVPNLRPCSEKGCAVLKSTANSSTWEIYINADVKYKDNSIASFSLATPFNRGITSTGNKIDSFSLSFTRPGLLVYNMYPGIGINNVTISRFDTLNRIVAGTFEATVYFTYNASITDSLKITDGRFDFKF